MMDFSPVSEPICIDTGSSCCISNNKNDFISLSTSPHCTLRGISSGLSVEGSGTLQWVITNDAGDDVILQLSNCLYIPSVLITY
jgi:hypothetical protein